LNFDKIWWKHCFHQISSNFIKRIKVLKKNWTLMKFDEIWWKHGFSSNFIKFHQSSSKKSRFWKKMNFDEIWWKHGFSSNFIKFHQKNQGFEKKMNFDEIWWKPGFHQISSKFIKTKFIWKKINNQWLKPDLDLQHLEKVEINVTNVCWTLVLVLNLYVLYVCLVSNINLFWFGKYWKTRVLLK